MLLRLHKVMVEFGMFKGIDLMSEQCFRNNIHCTLSKKLELGYVILIFIRW